MDYEALISNLLNELNFSFSRSGGSGGQHVNKVETKVILNWDVRNSETLNEIQKSMISEGLSRYITNDGILQMYNQTERSQLKNKQLLIKRWRQLVINALKPRKKRKKTKPSKQSILRNKKKIEQRKQIKAWRQKPRMD